MRKQLLVICSILFVLILSATASATDYYVDATAGNDNNNGTSTGTAWKTIAKVNASSFSAGDTIKFQCGEVWRETLTVPSSGSAGDGNEITFTNYGTGANPLIRQTEEYNDWTEVNDTYDIYRGGVIGSNLRYFGMLNSDGNDRVPCYVADPPFSEWADDYFCGYGLNYSNPDGYFYYRSTSGNPGAREVGVRRWAIYINAKNYIVIDGIDFYGPTGTTDGEAIAHSTQAIYPYNCTYLTIKNCNFKCCRNYAIRSNGSSAHHITVEDCTVDRGWGGISFVWMREESSWNVNNVRRCTVTNSGLCPGDAGDRGNIVCTGADSITIEDCYTEGADNNDGKTTDFSMAFADGASYIRIQRNYIKNARMGGIVYVGDTNDRPGNIDISYNIFENWGIHEASASGSHDAVKIGATDKTQWPYCGTARVYNNLFIDGNSIGANSGDDVAPHSALEISNWEFNDILIKNNVFYKNGNYLDFQYLPGTVDGTKSITNNWFYRIDNDQNSVLQIGFPDKMYQYDELIGGSSGYWQYDKSYVADNNIGDPCFLDAANSDYHLASDSPLIDAGNDVSLTEDYEGNPVPSGSGVDIGAYEFGAASNPSPEDEATSVSTTADFSWTAGAYAADTNGSEVYLGTNEQTVADANHSSNEYKGATDGNTYDPGTMSGGETYYWAIDTVNDGNTWAGSVWSFTTTGGGSAPGQASNPSPANSATNVGTTTDLSWTAGTGATSYDVYFGTTSPGTSQGNQAGTTYDTGTMSNSTTYYWRIDPVNASGTTTGSVWSFTTASAGSSDPNSDPNLIMRLEFDEGSGSTAYDSSNSGTNDGTLTNMESGDWVTGHDGNGLEFDGTNEYITCGNDSSLDITGALTICAWIDWDGYGSASDRITLKGDELGLFLSDNSTSRIGYYGSFGGGASTYIYIPSTAVGTGSWIHLAVTYADDATHRLTAYNNGAEDGATTNYSGALGTNTDNLLIGNNAAMTRGFDGTMDDVRIYNRQLSASDINDIYTGNEGGGAPGKASSPTPANSATSVGITTDLSWSAGIGATSHDVYFGTSSPGTSQGNQAGTTYDTGTMTANTTYYWRIDEINANGTTTGDVWSFTTLAVPGQASSPSPANSATSVSTTADLSWTAGSGATSYDVYFGTTSPGTSQGNQAGTTFDTGTMSNSTTYYWRIDPVNASGTTTGTVWSFTTAAGGVDPNLVSWWKFDESTGSNADDSAGNNDGTLVNMTNDDWVTGQIDNALDFDGGDDYVNSGSDSSLNIGTGSYTVSAWIYPDELDNTQYWDNGIFKKEGDANNYFLFRMRDEDSMQFYSKVSGTSYNNSSATMSSGYDFTKNSWYHVAFVIDRSDSKFKTYHNADLALNSDFNNSISGISFSPSGDAKIGVNFNGLIDDLRVYDKALSASDVNDLYQAGL